MSRGAAEARLETAVKIGASRWPHDPKLLLEEIAWLRIEVSTLTKDLKEDLACSVRGWPPEKEYLTREPDVAQVPDNRQAVKEEEAAPQGEEEARRQRLPTEVSGGREAGDRHRQAAAPVHRMPLE